MKVLLFATSQLTFEIVPKYVVPIIVVLVVLIILGSFVLEHFAIVRAQKVKAHEEPNSLNSVVEEPNSDELIQEEVRTIDEVPKANSLGDSIQEDVVDDYGWVYPSFFSCHMHDSSRLRIDTEVLHALRGDDLKRLTEDERWFVDWYHKERKKGLTHFSTFGPLSLPDASQDEVCKELRAMLTAPTIDDDEIF